MSRFDTLNDLGMMLSEKQCRAFHQCNRRINILDGAVRSGKTFVSYLIWLHKILYGPPGPFLMAGLSQSTLYRNVIEPLQQLVGPDMVYRSSRGEVHLWGRTIYCVGAGNSDGEGRIRGLTLAGALGDEVCLWPESFFKMLMSRLSIKGAQFLGTTNPDSPMHWLKKKWLDRSDVLRLRAIKFVLDDNPGLDEEYKAALKAEYTGLWYKRFILGLWAVAEGIIYDFFTEEYPYLRTDFPKADYHAVSCDYGTANPTAFGLFGVNKLTKPRAWMEKEYYYCARETGKQKTDQDYVDDFFEWIGDVRPREVIVDPSARSFIILLRRELMRKCWGTRVVEANNDVVDGIRTHSRLLNIGDYSIHPKCRKTIEEYFLYIWDEKKQKRGEDAPVKEHDHTKDLERYFLHTTFGQERFDLASFVND